MIERKTEEIRHIIEFVVRKMQRLLRHDKRIELRLIKEEPLFFTVKADKLIVERNIVRHKRAACPKLKKVG